MPNNAKSNNAKSNEVKLSLRTLKDAIAVAAVLVALVAAYFAVTSQVAVLQSEVTAIEHASDNHITRFEHEQMRDRILDKLDAMDKRLEERDRETKRRLTCIEQQLEKRKN